MRNPKNQLAHHALVKTSQHTPFSVKTCQHTLLQVKPTSTSEIRLQKRWLYPKSGRGYTLTSSLLHKKFDSKKFSLYAKSEEPASAPLLIPLRSKNLPAHTGSVKISQHTWVQ